MPKRVGPRAKLAAVKTARGQRKALTPPEFKLWEVLKGRPAGFRFRKQHPLGDNLSLDFFCPAARLNIEVDGEAHDRGDRPQRDERRDALLASYGIVTLRVPAIDVLRNLEGVVQAIVALCVERTHPATPGPSGPAVPLP